jgi:hypothetical protein
VDRDNSMKVGVGDKIPRPRAHESEGGRGRTLPQKDLPPDSPKAPAGGRAMRGQKGDQANQEEPTRVDYTPILGLTCHK